MKAGFGGLMLKWRWEVEVSRWRLDDVGGERADERTGTGKMGLVTGDTGHGQET